MTVPPINTGQSKAEADRTSKKPEPGMSKTTSSMATPEKAIGNVTAIDVIKNGSAFLKACLNNTFCSLNPFALAVLM